MTAFALLGLQGKLDPRRAVTELQSERDKRIADAIRSGKSADFAKFDKDMLEGAKAKLKDVSTSQIVDKEALDWASLFSLAERHQDARVLIERFLKLPLSPEAKFSAQLALCDCCFKLNDGSAIYNTLMKVMPPSGSQATWLGSLTGGTYHYWVRDAKGAKGALEVVQRVKSFLPSGPLPTAEEAKDVGWAKRQIADCEATYLAELGKRDDAIKVLNEALSSLPKDVYRLSELGLSKKRIEMLDRLAPELPFGKSHGEFKGLEAFRGRVVLIEFTAHWCHACHEALPSIRKLAAELSGKPFDMLSVTTYYGHFLAERSKDKDMPREVEFNKMPSLMRELGITWPMVYVEREVMTAYGISGIPEFIVLDKKGNVQMLDLGFSKAKFGRLREKIEELLKS